MPRIRKHPWRQNPAPLPDPNQLVVAIGDVHGRADLFDDMLGAIAHDVGRMAPSKTTCVQLGDLIDRGAESLDCLGLAMDGLAARVKAPVEDIVLLGNHDASLKQALFGELSETDLEVWAYNGGRVTWESFGLFGISSAADLSAKIREALPADIKRFVSEMRLSHRIGDWMFVHAGLDPRRSLDDQDPEALIWIRGAFLDAGVNWPFEVRVVHGHTIEIPARGEPELHSHRVCLDTGAYHTNILTAMEIIGDRLRFLQTTPD